MITFVPEVHSESVGRKFVLSKIKGREIDVFFIEFSNQGIDDRFLQDVLNDNVGTDKTEIEIALAGYFTTLSSDANPNIRELTIDALSRGIRVVAVDLSREEVDTQFSALAADTNLPQRWQSASATNYAQYEKLALRNDHMASQISRHMVENTSDRALFLCGEKHFQDSVTQAEINRYGWPTNLPTGGVDTILTSSLPAGTRMTTKVRGIRWTDPFAQGIQQNLMETPPISPDELETKYSPVEDTIRDIRNNLSEHIVTNQPPRLGSRPNIRIKGGGAVRWIRN